jgi:NADH-quinone oxidoreductase subunit E
MSVRRLAPAEVQPQSFALTAENETWADGQVAKYPEGRQASAVIPLLWKAQEQAGGWLPQKAIEAVAQRLGMPYIRVFEVATFYTMFNLEPVGRYFVQLCGTVPCHIKGALDLKRALHERIGDQRHVTADGNFSWLEVECLGACCNAPMVQINMDYYEDLTPESLNRVLDDLAAGRPVKPGPQNGRVSSEPEGGAQTLTDPALFDGSMIGAWRSRFEPPKDQPATGEAASAEQRAAADPKPAKPDAGRPIASPAADTPAQRVNDGKSPINPAERAGAGNDAKTTVVDPATGAGDRPKPQSNKSYTPTPSKPEEGRTVAGSKGTTPVAGTPPSEGGADPQARPGKPVGSEIPPDPGVPPKP